MSDHTKMRTIPPWSCGDTVVGETRDKRKRKLTLLLVRAAVFVKQCSYCSLTFPSDHRHACKLDVALGAPLPQHKQQLSGCCCRALCTARW